MAVFFCTTMSRLHRLEDFGMLQLVRPAGVVPAGASSAVLETGIARFLGTHPYLYKARPA